MKSKLLSLALALTAILIVAGSALAVPPGYTIFNIGLIDPSDYGSQGRDVSTTLGNATGRCLGNNNQAIFWTEETGLVALPNDASRPYAEGNGVNIYGTVVGTGTATAWGANPIPLIWEAGAVSPLPLPAGQDIGRAQAVNNLGEAAGSVNGGSLQQAALFSTAGSVVVSTLTSTGCYGVSFFDINDAGLAAGSGIDPNDAARNVGFVYDRGTDTAFEVGALPNCNGAICFGVSPAGHVVGSSMMFQGSGVPFVWSEAGGMQAVPLPEGTDQGIAKGVNSSGWVVGYASNAFSIPFLFDGEATYRIADLVDPASGWGLDDNTSSSAMSISDEGIIVGTGEYYGVVSAYAMVPDDVVPLLLQEFTAQGSDQGIEVTWELALVNGSPDFFLERSVSMNGPWAAVTAPVSFLGASSTVMDTDTESGQTYYYRLAAAGNDGTSIVMGLVAGQRTGFVGVSLGLPTPNPAVGGTALAYRLPVQQNVQITVHDLRGRLVRTLVNGSAADGEHMLQWDGKDNGGQRAPAGVYFFNMKTRQGNLTQRVVLTR
jgi:hypothetical protein